MEYRKVRATIKNGDVITFRGRSLWSRLIRLRSSARVTHVGLAVWARDRLCVFEARERIGVRLYPMSAYVTACRVEGVQVDWHKLQSSPHGIDRQKVVEWATMQWGKRYASAWQFLRSYGPIAAHLADVLGVPVDVNGDRFYCSEYVLAALRHGGYAGEAWRKAASTTPGDVVELPCLHRMGAIVDKH